MDFETLNLLTLALMVGAVLLQGLIGWRWTLAIGLPLVWFAARRPMTLAALVIVGGW